jgi:hemolysin III
MAPRTKLKDRLLPDYTKGEEIANMVTHIVGGAFGIVALILCVVFSALRKDAYYVVGSAIYGSSLIALYTMSSVYHGIHPKVEMGKKVMQVLDHCTIYYLIGGTYTIVALGPLREYRTWIGWTIFGIVWGLCVFATVFTAIDFEKYTKLSMACYIGIGWIIILFIKPTIAALTMPGFIYLLLGGVSYTVGASLYAIDEKKRYIHATFHIFVLIGTVLQFVSIFKYAILR